MWMFGCQPAEKWRWLGWNVGAEPGILREKSESEKSKKNIRVRRAWNCGIWSRNMQYAGMCEGINMGQTSNPSLEWEK